MLCTPLYPMVLLIIIPFWKMAISLGILTQHFQTNPYNIRNSWCFGVILRSFVCTPASRAWLHGSSLMRLSLFSPILSFPKEIKCPDWRKLLAATQNFPDTLCDQDEVGRLIADVAKIIPAFLQHQNGLSTGMWPGIFTGNRKKGGWVVSRKGSPLWDHTTTLESPYGCVWK